MHVINLIGQPGAGKTTLALGVAYALKCRGENAEFVTEYTKDLIYESNTFVMGDELMVFAEKYQRLKRLLPSVDYAVSDSPLVNSLFYSDAFGPEGTAFFRRVAEGFNNTYVFVERVVPYVPHARMSDESQADQMGEVIRRWLDENNIPYLVVPGTEAALDTVMGHLEKLGVVAPR